MIPVGIAGFFMADIAKEYFNGNMMALGFQFIFSAGAVPDDFGHKAKGKIHNIP